ncbi:M20 family metallopeptidase [Desulfopila sp. IMCC35006]|uniref:M20 family metallopeptidase n=1 Tax=Desulfopila sp. IMCC35006 TaxID=2569542 RepID=UPI00142EEC50|nr:M20 family metallopeptidase [Desulfopila sp. IMCC35006]
MNNTLAVSLARQLIRVNTVNPPGNEADAVRIIAPLLQDAGFHLKEYQYGTNRSSLVAHKGRMDRPAVILSGHLDTVPFGSQPWQTDPLGALVVEDKLFGRGAADMKGGVAVLVAAAIHFADKIKEKPVTLVLSADEEIGCAGAASLISQKVLPRARCILVAEPTGNIPRLGHKGVFWLKTLFHGKTAHAAFPELGINALLKAARAVVALNGDIVRGKAHDVMGEATLVTSRFLSGDNYNSVPDLAEVGIDIRSTVNWSHTEILHKITTLLAPLDPEFEVIFDLPPLWTPPESDGIPEIFAACDTVRKQTHPPAIVTFYTDGGILGPGLGNAPVVVLGPGDSGMAHKVDEYVMVNDLLEGVALYLEILARLCL